MIPNLGRLSMHDVANTMGFYELTDEERQQLDDDDVNDPVSMERPVHTMTFRVRLADDGPNGEPRYKYFSPHQLWRWVSENNSLPAREGPIWYEDWWALCNTYNPDHHNIPAWAHRLKHRSEYVAERARERAAQEQQAARANARAAREGEPREETPAQAQAATTTTRLPRLRAGEERMGPQRATDHLSQWVFWLKPASDAAAEPRLNSEDVNEGVRRKLMRYMWTNFTSPEAVTNVIRRLEVRAYPFYATFTGETQPSTNAPVLLVVCKMWLPSLAPNYFLNFFHGEKRRYMGICSMMRRWLGIIGAEVTSPGEEAVLSWYASWRHMQGHPQSRPAPPESYGPFTMRRDSYNNWRPYSLESDPLRIIPGHKGPQSATDVAIEWRLWVKGNFPDDARVVATHVRSFLSRWFHNQGQFESQRNLDIPQRLSLTTSFGIATRNAVADMDSPVSRIDFQLYMPNMTLAQAFVDACKNIGLNATTRGSQPEDGFDVIMNSIVGVGGARLASPADFFHIRMGPLRQSRRMGSCTREVVPKPNMGRREYEQWPQHTFFDLPPVIRVVEPGQSEAGPSSSAAFREQAREERLDEAQRAPPFGDSDDSEEHEEMEEEVMDEGTVGPSSSLPYEPTSPSYSPTSPSYDPTDPPTIDPMTPDREGGESMGAQRAYMAMDPNDPEYAVTIRWRFWLKGSMDSLVKLDAEEAMRSEFAAYMANNSDLRAGNNGFPWYYRVRVEIFEREYGTQSRNGVSSTNPLLRCEVSLKVSEETAYRFVSWSMNDRTNWSSWADQAEAWHNYGTARAQDASDFPRVVDSMTQYPSPPDMSSEDYHRWVRWGVIRQSIVPGA